MHHNTADCSSVISKWTETHSFRIKELKDNISTYDYISKNPALHGIKGIELVRKDVQMLHEKSETVDNWLALYPKVLGKARTLRASKVCDIISEIDNSSKERKYDLKLVIHKKIIKQNYLFGRF